MEPSGAFIENGSMKAIRKILLVLIVLEFLSGSAPFSLAFQQLAVVYREPACSYFIAEGRDGTFRIFEWRDGYDPQPGELMLGKLQPAGYSEIYYPDPDRKGAVRLVSTHDTRGKALQRYYDYCH